MSTDGQGITAHWIDDKFRLQDCLLGFIPLKGSHTGVNLAKYVGDVLDKFEIGQKLFCITTDGATNNQTMMDALSDTLRAKYDVTIDPEQQRVPCLAHIINLVVCAFLDNLKVVDPDSDIDDDDESVRNRILQGELKDFACTVLKIREITKVQFRNI
jgi:hypothetical protein